MRRISFKILILILLIFGLTGCSIIDIIVGNPTPPHVIENGGGDEDPNNNGEDPNNNEDIEESDPRIDINIVTNDHYEVALYIHVYGRLPKNYFTKSEIKGHIANYYTEENKKSIGGDIFFNREGLLPKKSGRTYYEADVNYRGQLNRGQQRIVYSNDGLIFYTNDHYGSFKKYDPEDGKWKSY